VPPRIITIADLHALAASRGGRCLADTYVSENEPLPWECAQGHRFIAAYRRVRRRGWCPECRLAALGIVPEPGTRPPNRTPAQLAAEVQAAAERNGGRWVSGEVHGRESQLTLECAEGHVWLARVGNVVDGSWCHVCGRRYANNWLRRRRGVVLLPTAADVARFAGERGLAFVEVAGLPVGRRHFFRCGHGHLWEEPVLAEICWCPGCGERGEALGLGRFGR